MWDNFGLRGNPFEINAVEKEGIIPLSTFVGRTEDRSKLRNTISTRSRSLSLIVGEKGVGKTSLGNVARFDLFEEYFTPITEIDCQSEWTASDFIIQIIGTLYEQEETAKLYSDLPKSFIKTAEELHKELRSLFLDESSGFNIQGGVGLANIGGGYSHSMKINRYTMNSLNIITNNYKGLILQFNNLDNLELDPKRLSQILADLRDFLLTDKAHFIFLGNKAIEGSFKDNPKVGDCISSDIQLGSLQYDEILKILTRRYEIFRIQNRTIIPPVHEEAVKLVYHLYNGNIRHIFYSLDKAVVNSEEILKSPLHTLKAEETQKVLYQLGNNRLTEGIQPRAASILLYMINKNKEVTNAEIARRFKIKTQNTSKYLKQLKDNNLITNIDYGSREVYYKIVEEAKWLLLEPPKGQQGYIAET